MAVLTFPHSAALAAPAQQTATGRPADLTLSGVSKTFPGVRALDRVTLTLKPGRVTALIGENGAGKSTLVKILTGIYQPDEGEIRINDAPVAFADSEAAQRAGVTAIHQETVLFDELSVAENIFVGHAPRTRFGLMDWRRINAEAARILNEIEAPLQPTTRLRDLSIAQRHLVAIARALSVDARVVIMDEPTAALSHKEAEELFRLVEKLKQAGKAILFISHKFEEIYRIADDYAVFRDGKSVGAGRLKDVSQADLVKLMVGRDVDQVFPKGKPNIGGVVMTVRHFSHPTEFDDLSLDLRKGEILGLYGLVGAGRSEFAQALFGVTKPSGGAVEINGKTVKIRKPAEAISAGLAYVPEERGRHGAVLPLSVSENIALPSLRSLHKLQFLSAKREYGLSRVYANRLDLRASSLSQMVGTLSGGNQQKVVIGKWLATKPKVIILDEPTKGIDVGSKSAVHAFMSELAAEGLAVIMISSELPEILGMSDRVMVMREGRMAGTFERQGLTAETLVRAATGNA